MQSTQRIDKYLSNIGICSRRSIKKLLKEHEVTVNGKRIRESGTRIDPTLDTIQIDGEQVKPSKLLYYLLNKPKGIVSTTSDEYGREDVTSLIPTTQRIYPVGRLDKDTTGLILLTNDGELTHKLTHPKYHVYKVYKLTIEGEVSPDQLETLKKGVILSDGITSPAKVKILEKKGKHMFLEMEIHEGRNRQVRRMCETVGIELKELERIKFGPIPLGNLPTGKYRVLSEKEVELLRKEVQKEKLRNN